MMDKLSNTLIPLAFRIISTVLQYQCDIQTKHFQGVADVVSFAVSNCPIKEKRNGNSDSLKCLNPELFISCSKQMDLKAVNLLQITESALVSVISYRANIP